MTVKEVDAGGNIGREEIGFKNLTVSLPIEITAVSPGEDIFRLLDCVVPIAFFDIVDDLFNGVQIGILNSGVAQYSYGTGQEYKHCHHSAEERFEEKSKELFEGDLE